VTDEIDPRLVALGLIPGPAATPAPPKNEGAVATAAPTPAPAQPGPTDSLFAGMGKFTGMPADAGSVSSNPFAAPPETVAPSNPSAPPQSAPAADPWTTVSTAAPPTTFAEPAPAATPATFAEPAPAAPTYDAPSESATTPAYAPPTFVAAPPAAPAPMYVAPTAPQQEAPLREAPPPLPPLASAMPSAMTVEAPAPEITVKKEKGKPKEKPAKVAKVAKVAKPEKAKPAPKPRFVLPPSGVLLRGPIVMGYPEKKLQITLEQLGFRINSEEPVDVAWTDVRDIKARRGRVVVRTKGRPVAFGIPVEGVSEPTLAGPLARVVKEASGGSLDLAGSSFLELQNATDSLRDRFHDEDDPLVPTVVGLVFGLAGLTFTALLPDALAIATRTPLTAGAYLLDYPLAGFDPRILVAAFGAGAMLAAGIVRVAMGKAATAWARGTLRGWHEGARRPVDLARRWLANIVLNPAISAAIVLAAIVTTLPSARVQTVIDQSGFHIMRELPFFDDDRSWTSVTNMELVSAPTQQHFEGVAVLFTFDDDSPVSTRDAHLRGGTDKQLLTSATEWRRLAR
jgi:hypothetical protein